MNDFNVNMMGKALGPIKAEMDALLALPESELLQRKKIPDIVHDHVRELHHQKFILDTKTECSFNLFKRSKEEGDAEGALRHFDEHQEHSENRRKIFEKFWSTIYKSCEIDPNKIWSYNEKDMTVELDAKSTIGKYVERRLLQEAVK